MKAALKNIELRLRAKMPSVIRAGYRMARSLGQAKASCDLPPDLVENCRLCASRVHMLDVLPKGGCVAELGTYKGDFARQIFNKSTPRELHLVDLDYSQFNDEGLGDQSVHRHEGLTHEVITSFEDEFFDWVYVDADHSFEGVMRDARATAAKIKAGGFIVFNDFAHIDPFLGRYGVHRAAVDFAVEMGWPLRYFAYERNALYDIALQKPERSKVEQN